MVIKAFNGSLKGITIFSIMVLVNTGERILETKETNGLSTF